MARQIILSKRDGQVRWEGDLDYLLSTLRNGQYVVTVKRLAEKRSIAQNDLMWMWLTCVERETGTPKEDAYLYFCEKFLSKFVTLGEKTTRTHLTSSNLNTEQMSEFLEKIQADVSAELGIQLPCPEDLYWEAFFTTYNS